MVLKVEMATIQIRKWHHFSIRYMRAHKSLIPLYIKLIVIDIRFTPKNNAVPYEIFCSCQMLH